MQGLQFPEIGKSFSYHLIYDLNKNCWMSEWVTTTSFSIKDLPSGIFFSYHSIAWSNVYWSCICEWQFYSPILSSPALKIRISSAEKSFKGLKIWIPLTELESRKPESLTRWLPRPVATPEIFLMKYFTSTYLNELLKESFIQFRVKIEMFMKFHFISPAFSRFFALINPS